MDLVTFAGLLLVLVALLIVEKLLLGPIDLVSAFHLPTWTSVTAVLLLLAWLMGK
jgi:hypothetical protein